MCPQQIECYRYISSVLLVFDITLSNNREHPTSFLLCLSSPLCMHNWDRTSAWYARKFHAGHTVIKTGRSRWSYIYIPVFLKDNICKSMFMSLLKYIQRAKSLHTAYWHGNYFYLTALMGPVVSSHKMSVIQSLGVSSDFKAYSRVYSD